MKQSFGGILRQRLLEIPEQVAFTFEGEDGSSNLTTYSDLLSHAVSIGSELSLYANRGDRVMLMMQPGLDYIATFLACWLHGLVAVPSYPPRRDQSTTRVQNIIGDCSPAIVVTDQISVVHVAPVFPATLVIDEIVDQAVGVASSMAIVNRLRADEDAGDVVFLQYTSGSTGSPKGTIVSQGNLLHNSAEMARKFNTGATSRMASWLPPYHDMGLILGILHPLFTGFPAHLMAPAAFMRKPLDWLRTIARHRATISGGPNFAFDLCVSRAALSPLEPVDLSTWKVAFNGAEPIHAGTLRRFASSFSEYGFAPQSLHPCYGLAENTLMVSGQDTPQAPSHFIRALDSDAVAPKEIVDCGSSIAGQTIRIIDPETGTECQDGQVGEIWITGPSVALGYWDDHDRTSTTFRARLNDPQDTRHYLRTGDLGQLLDGKLFVRGRIKDLIIIRGVKYYAQDIERAVTDACEVIRPGGYCAAVQIDDAGTACIGIAAELVRKHRKMDTTAVASSIRALVSTEYGLRVAATVFIGPGQFPKTTSGKIPRDLIRQTYFQSTLARQHAVATDG